MSATLYPYASGDRLADRNTYFYSAYRGCDFLRAWIAQRDAVLAELAQPAAAAPRSLGPAAAPGPDGVATAALLEHLFRAADEAAGAVPQPAGQWLDRMIQRFEVTKRIHDAYDRDWRAPDRDAHRTLALYVRFAEVVEAAYRVDRGFARLNALLKCLDTLSSVRGELGAGESARLARLILAERRHVAELAARVGVER